ncbi:hypothetical protein E2320_017321 [Naja naja]|nr:hypothetical protein E2320_017321 [Naja naja]
MQLQICGKCVCGGVGIKSKCFHLYFFRIKQEWDIMLDCRRKGIPQTAYLNNGFIDTNSILDKLEKNSPLIKKIALLNDKERSKFIFQLSGEHWTELPDWLKEKTYLKEWHVNNTQISSIPSYIALFQELKILELSSNQITDLPVEIGRCLFFLINICSFYNNKDFF